MSEHLSIMPNLPDPRIDLEAQEDIGISSLEALSLRIRIAELERRLELLEYDHNQEKQLAERYQEAHFWIQTALDKQLDALATKARKAYENGEYNSPHLIHYFAEQDNRKGEKYLFEFFTGETVMEQLLLRFRLKRECGGFEWLRPSTIDLMLQIYNRMQIAIPQEQFFELLTLRDETRLPHANLVVLQIMKRTQAQHQKALQSSMEAGVPMDAQSLYQQQVILEQLAAEQALILNNQDKNLLAIAWQDTLEVDEHSVLSPNGILLILTVYGVEQLITDQDLRREIIVLQRLDEEKPFEAETIEAIHRTLKNVVDWQACQEETED